MITMLEESGTLRFYVESLNDIERVRIAMENRLRAMTRDEADSDGEIRGMGLSPDDPNVLLYANIVGELQKIETMSIKVVQKAIKQGPMANYVKDSKGVGEKQIARLLACTGDPYWHVGEDRPRTVPELWAYCGYSVQNGHAQKRTKGQLSNWSNDAKMRAFLIAESCVKSKGTYRDVYDEWRKNYAESVHPHDCARCGPKGKPALTGSPLSLGHQHARALRKVAKRVLADMWQASKEMHETQTSK